MKYLEDIESIKDSELSRWKRRRWNLLKRVLLDPEFQEILPELRSEYRSRGNLPGEATIRTVRTLSIPNECLNCLYELYRNPDIKSVELLELIRPPVSFISYKHQVKGPASDMKAEFSNYEKTVKDFAELGADYYSQGDLFLQIDPLTTAEELREFVTEYYEQFKVYMEAKDTPFTHDELKPGRRVTDKSKADALERKILMMNERYGMQPKEIADELPGSHEPSNIRKILSRARKRRK